MNKLNYQGDSKILKNIVNAINELIEGGGGSGDVADVTVNGTSVVDPTTKIAEVEVPIKVSDLTNDSGFITSTVSNLVNYYTKSETYTQAEVDALISAIVTLNILVVQTLPTTDISRTTIYLVPKSTPDTQDVYDEYINLDGTSSGWEHIGSTQIDLSNYYTKSQVDTLLASKANTADLAGVATSGSYNDLSNKPTIPTQLSQLSTDSTHRVVTDTEKSTWNGKLSDNPTFTEASTRANIASGESFATILGKIKKFFTDLKTVAFTGSYNDLTNKPTIPAAQVNSDWNATSGVAQILNKPTIPTVNNATLTIQKNGTTVKTFTANASTNVTANITVPTKASELTNDSGYVTTDTKNTAGSTDSSSKLFLIGATSQAANPQTYSHDTAYVGTDGCLYSGGTKVLTAHQDISGKVNKSGDTMSGNLTIQRTSTNEQNSPATLNLWTVDSTNSVTSKGAISAYDGGASGANMVITPNGNLFVGSGEAPYNHYSLYKHSTTEVLYMTSDNHVHIQANGQTIANRLGLMIDNGGNVLPEKADVATNNSGSIGTSSYKWANGYFTNINGVAVGDSPKFTDTTYSAGTGISLSGTTFSNSGVRDISINGNYLRKNVNGTNTDLTIPFATSSTTASKLGSTTVGNSTRGIYLNAGSPTAVSWYPDYCTIDSGNTANYPWHRFATCTTGTGAYVDRDVVVILRSRYNGGAYGAIKLSVRTNSTGSAMQSSATWIYRYGFDDGDVIITNGGTTGTDTTFDAWVKCGTYARRIGYIYEGSNNGWSLVDSNEVSNTTATDKKTSTEVFASVSGNVAKDGATVANANTVNNLTVQTAVPANAKFTDTTYSAGSNITLSGTTFSLTKANVTGALGYTPPTSDTNTHRPIQVNGTEILGNNTTALNLKAGSNVSVTNSSGTVTIAATDTDTKNTAGSTDTSSKIFLIGATSQAANPQTYSDNEVYATSGVLTTKKLSAKALTALTGTGTAGADKGAGVSPRYIPSLWTFNSGVTVANGEVYLIKIPVAGGTYGVWLSLNNGTNYYPVAISNSTGRFTTQYGNGTVIAVTYESAGKCTCYPKDGGDTTSSVTGIFRVLNDYDANSNVTQTATTTNANYEVLFSQTADNTTRTEGARKTSGLRFNPSTNTLMTSGLTLYGDTLNLATSGSSSNKSADIIFYYGSGSAKAKIWMDDTYTADSLSGPNYQINSSSGTASSMVTKLATLVDLGNYLPLTGGSLTNNLTIKSGKALYLNQPDNTKSSSLLTSSNGTLTLKAVSWMNLCTPQQVQCRNANDTGWVNIAAANIESSRRFKENIKDLTEEEARKLLDVRTVTFDFKEEYAPSSDWEHERFHQQGVIAEEVKDIFPTLVRYSNYENPDEEPIPTFVEYSHFVPYLIKMIQMQQKEIDDLKVQIDDLNRRIK